MLLPLDSKPPVSGLLNPLTDLFIRWKTVGRQDDLDDDGRPDPLVEQARRSAWILRRFYEEATRDNFAEEALREFRLLIPSGVQAARFFVVWIDLVETLCQEAERVYGTKSGQGPYKATQVKAAMIHLLLDKENFDIPKVPNFLEPIIVEAFVNIFIDIVVKLLNRDKIWMPAPPGPVPSRNLIAGMITGLMRFGKWVMKLAPMVRFGAWIRKVSLWAILKGNPLTPAVKRQVERIENLEGPSITEVLRRIEHLIKWMIDHRSNIVALIELVSVAAQEAESFIELSGSDKKIYARELILAFLEDYDIIRTQLAYIITEWVLDWAIDSVVRIFNKRGAFQQRTAAA